MFRQSPGIKVCGLTEPANALDCLQAGADWLGLNFHPASPRYVAIERAEAILSALPSRSVAVGLFVNRPPDEIKAVCDRLGLSRVQLHGDEPAEDVAALGDLFVIRAFRLRDASAVAEMSDYLERGAWLGRPPDALLIDAWTPGLYGGAGALIADDLIEGVPPHPRLMLAGGLTADNVASRVARVRPWMVDAASGVESSPGIKDLDKVRALVHALSLAS